jgi:hypothetical protein
VLEERHGRPAAFGRQRFREVLHRRVLPLFGPCMDGARGARGI